MDKLKALFLGSSEPPAFPSTSADVSVHRLSQQPTLAWDQLKSSQCVKKVTPLDSDTPVSADKIRFVCLSDTHSTVEKLDNFVPPGDVLLHAGDFTQLGFPCKIQEFNDFLGSLPHKVKVVIAGNHDLTLDDDMVKNKRSELEARFYTHKHNFEDYLEEAKVSSSRELLTNCIYLLDSYVKVCGIKIYGSPWQPKFGGWAFNMNRGAACLDKWNQIPEDTDILMTHGPPIGKQLHLEMESDDVKELMAPHGEELSAEDLIQLEKQIIEEEEEEEARAPELKRFTIKGLAEGFAMIEEGMAKFEAEDLNTAMYGRVYREVMDCLACYKEIWEEEKKSRTVRLDWIASSRM